MMKFLGELGAAVVVLFILTVVAAKSFPDELVQKLPAIAVRLEPQKNQTHRNLIVQVQSEETAPVKLTRLDFALFVVQSFTTTGYGNYNDLFTQNPEIKKIAILLMTCGGFAWAWLIAIFVDLLGH